MSEGIDRKASSTELTLCLICKVLPLRASDRQHKCSTAMEGPKRYMCLNKTGENFESMYPNLAEFEITQFRASNYPMHLVQQTETTARNDPSTTKKKTLTGEASSC